MHLFGQISGRSSRILVNFSAFETAINILSWLNGRIYMMNYIGAIIVLKSISLLFMSWKSRHFFRPSKENVLGEIWYLTLKILFSMKTIYKAWNIPLRVSSVNYNWPTDQVINCWIWRNEKQKLFHPILPAVLVQSSSNLIFFVQYLLQNSIISYTILPTLLKHFGWLIPGKREKGNKPSQQVNSHQESIHRN